MIHFEIPHDFEPRAYQVPLMEYLDTHPRGGRAVAVWPRRAGKDLTAMHETCKLALVRPGTYWHIYPTAEQARRNIWTGLTRDGQRIMEQVFPAPIRKTPRTWAPQGEMVVELVNGSIWRLMGSDRMEIVGAGVVGAVFSEYALAMPTTWDLVRPMLRETEGWALFISTPRGRNHLWERYEAAGQDGQWRDHRTIFDVGGYPGQTPQQIIAAERADGMPEALVRQEYLCDWTAANVGSVYGELLEALEKAGALYPFVADRGRVFTSWDLGGAGAKGDATAVWIWAAKPDGVDLIDYLEGTGKPLSYYHDEVDARLAALGLEAERHWLPFDATSLHLTGASVFEQTQERWPGRVALAPRRGLLDGIQACRWLLQQKVRVHPRCKVGWDMLRAYHYEWDPDRKIMSNTPVHDYSSHAADAARYMALVVRYSEMATRARVPKRDEIARKPTMDDLWADHDRRRRSA